IRGGRIMTDPRTDTVTLETMEKHPFGGGFSDWYGTEGEAVVTFTTIQHRLYSVWSRDCISFDHSVCGHEGDEHPDLVEEEETGMYRMPENCDPRRVVDHSKFDASKVRAPRIYRDDTHYDKEGYVDESYTIILPYAFMAEELCRHWIEKLNEEFDRDFELHLQDHNEVENNGG
ncbi:MAG: hypothetical protein SVS85_03560, partial [Candidatus Nanohaloarchaea archaeon]|nr:hypothetical protein [Candidatus Nanohaloarchaea archaeon]